MVLHSAAYYVGSDIKCRLHLPTLLVCECWSVNAGVRLYKETPADPPPSPSPTPSKSTRGSKDTAAAAPKGKGAKGRGKKGKKQEGLGGSLVLPPSEPSWELLASSTDELQAVGEDLTGQKANAEADIGYQVCLAPQILSVRNQYLMKCHGTVCEMSGDGAFLPNLCTAISWQFQGCK